MAVMHHAIRAEEAVTNPLGLSLFYAIVFRAYNDVCLLVKSPFLSRERGSATGVETNVFGI